MNRPPIKFSNADYERYRISKGDIPRGVDHKEYERRAKELARKAGV